MAHRTIKLILEYDGTDFVGWQYQKNGRSVQEVIENGLLQILREQTRIVGAGRTDSGVHAKGQVASFRTESSLNCAQIMRGLNGVLPVDAVVRGVAQVSDDFNARYSARSRRYQYTIRSTATALLRKYCWVLGYRLDLNLMNKCASTILGKHDFASFCKTESEVNDYLCTVYRAGWFKETDSRMVFDIEADRFLHGMVRTLVGTMVEIGRGYRRIEEFQQIMDARDRRRAGMAAPAQGLFLTEVEY